MDADVQGKVAVVTGAAQGIGRAIAETLIAHGACVTISDIQEEKGRATAAELGPDVAFHPCDIADATQVRGLIDAVVARHGRLDIAVNNAGINTGPENRVTIDQYPDEIWRRIVSVDLDGTFYCCKAEAAQMVKQGSGAIVNIASIAGVVPLRLQIGFVAAKAGVIRMTEAMAAELGPMGIRVNCVSPGSTLVQGTRQLFYNNKETAERLVSFIPQRRPGETNEIAAAVLFLVSGAGSYVNGHNLVVDGGWTCGFSRDF
ncbi:MAG TPA: SDR family NAD(P)-dependent oxidoreductase [Candidatus Hydrogenedentes bacterium]|nr:SDR family NAD(P)-dependent oxidoreductase [Candidatus Hydrogenedentota bacterium]HPG67752.1 SDR family NAD(P)-dependent oxidoreductase [Candidatus Hydrogenedentota bacterium]